MEQQLLRTPPANTNKWDNKQGRFSAVNGNGKERKERREKKKNLLDLFGSQGEANQIPIWIRSSAIFKLGMVCTFRPNSFLPPRICTYPSFCTHIPRRCIRRSSTIKLPTMADPTQIMRIAVVQFDPKVSHFPPPSLFGSPPYSLDLN